MCDLHYSTDLPGSKNSALMKRDCLSTTSPRRSGTTYWVITCSYPKTVSGKIAAAPTGTLPQGGCVAGGSLPQSPHMLLLLVESFTPAVNIHQDASRFARVEMNVFPSDEESGATYGGILTNDLKTLTKKSAAAAVGTLPQSGCVAARRKKLLLEDGEARTR
ncbi:hypothetical protein C8R46DRAFT_1036519 [Mycena filopes]|nr:hypothetical protein C8R46DRAFT_1036519 [Mycena filopes]